VQAIDVEHKIGEAFNFSIRNEMTNKDVAFKIAEELNFDTRNIILGKYPPNYPLRPLESDQTFISLDNTKAKRVLDWKPKVSFEEGLSETIDYWKKAVVNY
jgi:nucleoside-diphosphate-sugar epimerase